MERKGQEMYAEHNNSGIHAAFCFIISQRTTFQFQVTFVTDHSIISEINVYYCVFESKKFV
jgi:hypothetical protein